MNTFKRQVLLELFRVYDIILCMLAFTGAMVINRLPLSLPHVRELITIRISIANLITFSFFVLCWHLVFSMLGFYNSRRLSSIWREFIDIGKGSIFCTALIFCANLLRPITVVDSRFLFSFTLLLAGQLIVSRIFIRFFLKQLRKIGVNLRNVLIVGTNRNALAFGATIKNSPELGYNLKGYVDDALAGTGNPLQDQTIVSDIAHFKAFLRDNVVDEIFIFLPIQRFYDQINAVINIAAEQGILVRMKTEFFRLKNSYPKIEYLGDEMLLTYCTGQMRRRLLLFKKAFDFVSAFVLLLIVSPVLVAAAAAIKLTSRGPVFFVQERIGFNKRRFKLYKFRTMVPDAEKKMASLEHLNEIKGAAFKLKNDPRITPVGRILRKLSIDELPQLINVLKGDMSLVGPRPLPIRDFKGFNTDWHRRRFCVKPGITCLWQVSGRNNISFDDWMALDMKYIDNWSPMLDMKILLKTVPAVFSGHGAS
jgi:exopolysaccharide biosynthesis polyprenyl glycosylphosphotransferase